MFDSDTLPVPDFGLVCKRCGYPLSGLNEHECPECGRAFTMEEHIPDGAFPPLFADGKQVRATPEVVELLRAYHILFIEQVDPLRHVLGAMMGPPRRETATSVRVHRECYFEAIDLLRRKQFGEPMPDPPPKLDKEENWRCPKCHEQSPANFEICWNCGQ